MMNRHPFLKRGMHFSGVLLWSLALFAACVIGLFVVLGNYTSEDVQTYEQIMRGDDEKASLDEKGSVSNHQRFGLQKDLFLAGKEGRLEVRLNSERSELLLEQHLGRISIVEKMEDVTCFMQEEQFAILSDGRKAIRQSNGQFLIEGANPAIAESWLSSDLNDNAVPMQIIRRLDAATAIYHYKDGLFVAENVTIGRYLAAGHELVVNSEMQPLMKGVAKSVEFSMKEAEKSFQAHHLRATFYSQRKQ